MCTLHMANDFRLLGSILVWSTMAKQRHAKPTKAQYSLVQSKPNHISISGISWMNWWKIWSTICAKEYISFCNNSWPDNRSFWNFVWRMPSTSTSSGVVRPQRPQRRWGKARHSPQRLRKNVWATIYTYPSNNVLFMLINWPKTKSSEAHCIAQDRNKMGVDFFSSC